MGLQGISQFGSTEMQLHHTLIKKKASGIKQFILLTCTNKLSHTFSKPRPSLIILLILFKASIQQVYYHYLFGWIMHSKLLKGIRRFHLRKYLKICIFVPSYEYKVFCHIDNRTLNTLCT